MIEVLKQALNTFEDLKKNHRIVCVNEIVDLRQAIAELESQEPVAWPVLNTEEREALERFNETCEDGQEYDVSKSMMKHLAELGVVYSAGFGRYGFTEFGRAALNHPQPKLEQEQEPVAHCTVRPLRGDESYSKTEILWVKGKPIAGPLYNHPPQRTWVGLTDEEICMFSMWLDSKPDATVFTAIEAKLKEKNT
jgi:hypothetical protein